MVWLTGSLESLDEGPIVLLKLFCRQINQTWIFESHFITLISEVSHLTVVNGVTGI